MTSANPATLAAVRRCHAEHGEAWGVIEESGRDAEHHIGGAFRSLTEAVDYRTAHYDPPEREQLAVCIARWEPDGEFWSYDY